MPKSSFRSRVGFAAAIALASHFSLGCGGDEASAPQSSNVGAAGQPADSNTAPSNPSALPEGGATDTSPAGPYAAASEAPAVNPELAGTTPSGLGGAGAAAPAEGAAGAPSDAAPAPGVPGGPLGLETVRIVAVGDSITANTCWRGVLWQRLNQDFPSRFDLVGSHPSTGSGCTPAEYDQDNEGYGSALVTEIAAGVTTARPCSPACPSLTDLQQRFAAAPADVALMHFGTNDVWNGIATESIVSAYSAVLGALRAANPNVVVLVAQIIPMNVTDATCGGCTCQGCPTAIPALNARIVSWAAENGTSSSPIRVVDQFTGYDAVSDNVDGVHPTSGTGSQKIADQWYAALAPLF